MPVEVVNAGLGSRAQSPRATLYLGLGPAAAGVAYHNHVEGFLFVLKGAKKVFLYPPNVYPPLLHPSPFDQDSGFNMCCQSLKLANFRCHNR